MSDLSENLIEKQEFTYFYSLVQPKATRKQRRCLKCSRQFLSSSAANRLCASCAAYNDTLPLKAQYIASYRSNSDRNTGFNEGGRMVGRVS